MFSFSHMLVFGVIALIVLGPKQLPEVARTLGRFINDLKRTTDDFTRTIIDARESTNEELKNLHSGTVGTPTGNQPVAPTPVARPTDEVNQLSFSLKEEPLAAPYQPSVGAHSDSGGEPRKEPQANESANNVVASEKKDNVS